MLFDFFTKSKLQIGFDITSSGIFGVSLKKEKDGFVLQNYLFKKFEGDVVQSGVICDTEAFESVLNEFAKEEGFQGGVVNISLPSNTAFIKTIVLPDIPIEELKIIIPQEAAKHIPFSVNDMNVDFEVIRKIKDEASEKKEVEAVLVALARNIAKSYVDSFYKAGFNLVGIDLAPFSAARTLANANLIDEENLFMSLLISEEHSDINILSNGMPVFLHSAPLGRKNIIEAIAGALEIDFAQAEEQLSEVCLNTPGVEINSDIQTSKASNAARAVYNNIAAEVLKSMEFYASQTFENYSIETVVLSGSGACVQNIDKYFTHRLKADTVLCDVFENIDLSNCPIDTETEESANVELLSTKPSYVSSVGLALKG